MEVSLITRFITPLGIVVIMFGMGLSLTPADFRRVWVQPRAIMVGIVLQIIGLPILGLALISILNLNPMMAVAVMLMCACPGGAITNLVSFISKGDAALSVSLTSINSFITVFTIPLVVTFSLRYFMGEAVAEQVDVMFLCLGIIAITIPPIIIGMITKAKAPRLAVKSEKWVRKGTIVFLIFLVSFGLYRENRMFPDNYWELAAIAVTLCLSSALTGAVMGGIARLPRNQVLTLAIEVGLHNSALAIVIALSFLGIQGLAVFSAFYLVVEYILSGLLILVTNLPASVYSRFQKQWIQN
jgi:BASS family bile acid:Na+ symporter